jgi:hypothetical protein
MSGPYFGRWSAGDVYERRLDADWPDASDATATSGLVLLPTSSIAYSGSSASINPNGSISFTAVTYISAGHFGSTYSNYLIDFRGQSSSATGDPYFYIGTGAGASTTGWTYQYLAATSTSVTAARAGSGTSSAAYIADSTATQRIGFQMYLYGPYLAQPTAFRTVTVGDLSNAAIVDYAGTHNVSTSYTSWGIAPFNGTITGQISVYGFGE